MVKQLNLHIQLIYPDEELGKAVMDAFEYSTSIYKKK